jgi:hypothetical protein
MTQIRQIFDFSLNFARLKLRNIERLHNNYQSISRTPIETARFADHRSFFKSSQIQRKAPARSAPHNPPKINRNARVPQPPPPTKLGARIFVAKRELRWIRTCVVRDKQNGGRDCDLTADARECLRFDSR